MKRLVLMLGFGAAALALALWPFPWAGVSAPRFRAGNPVKVPQFQHNDYLWLADVPFQNGNIWLWAGSTGGVHSYLLDLEQCAIKGELFNTGPPVFTTRDGSKLLCEMQELPGNSLNETIILLFSKLTGRPAPRQINRVESFWVLDLKDNSSRRLGSVSQLSGAGSTWHPSPDFRRGYTVPTSNLGNSIALVLCDLEEETFEQINVQGYPKGWWDAQSILIRSSAGEFSLLDVTTRDSKPLLSSDEVARLLNELGLSNAVLALDAIANWNGLEYDFYLALPTHYSGLTNESSFLLKVDKQNRTFRLVSREFQFRWGARFDETGTRYLFQGEPAGPGKRGDGGVYLRNLADGAVTTLVPPDNAGQYSIPRFYSNEVIYFRNRLLHRVSLDGSRNEPLLKARR